MASRGAVELLFLGNNRSAIKAMREISAQADQTARRTATATDLMSTRMRKVGSGATAMGRAMVGASVPLIGLGYYSAKAAVGFQSSMEMIRTQAGASQGEVDRMSKAVLGMTQTMQVAQGPQQLSEGLYHLESVGLRGSAALQALKASADLAAVGGSNLEETSSALGAAWTSGIRGAGTFGQTVSTLNGIVGAGNMRMADLVQALSTGVLPAAKNAGLTLRDAGGALAVLTDSGYDASSAAAQLATALHFISNPTGRAQKALASMGISSTQLASDMHKPNGLLVALRDLKTHLGNLSPIQAEQTLGEILPGGRGRVLLTLMNSLDRYESKLGTIQQTSRSFTEDVTRTHQTAAFKIKRAWSQIQGSMIALGNTILPIVSTLLPKLVSIVQSVFGWFTKLPAPVREFVGGLIAFTVAAGAVLWTFGKIAGIIASVRTGWAAMSGQAARSNAQLVASSETTAAKVIASDAEIETANATAGASFAKLAGAGAIGALAIFGPDAAKQLSRAMDRHQHLQSAAKGGIFGAIVGGGSAAIAGSELGASLGLPLGPLGIGGGAILGGIAGAGAGLVSSFLHFAGGGIVPRTHPGIDRIPALLTGGEGVVNQDGMARLGTAGLNALNSGEPLQTTGPEQPLFVTAQTVVDGRVIAQSVSKYIVNKAARGTSSLVGGPLLTGVSGAIDLGQ